MEVWGLVRLDEQHKLADASSSFPGSGALTLYPTGGSCREDGYLVLDQVNQPLHFLSSSQPRHLLLVAKCNKIKVPPTLPHVEEKEN